MTWKVWKSSRSYKGSTIPMVAIHPKRFGLNRASIDQLLKGKKRAMFFTNPELLGIGFTFFDGEVLGSCRVICHGSKNSKGSVYITVTKLFEEHPEILARVAQLGVNKFKVLTMLKEDVPEDFKDSDCFFVRIEKE